MDEQSIWKKEISFRRRKPAAKPPVRESGPVEGVRGNREVPPSSADDSRVAASRTSDGDSPVAAPRSSAETPRDEATSIWKKEISFKGRKEPGPDSGLEEGDGGSPEVQPANAESSPAEKQ